MQTKIEKNIILKIVNLESNFLVFYDQGWKKPVKGIVHIFQDIFFTKIPINYNKTRENYKSHEHIQ